MKKYNFACGVYGSTTASRIAYWQKMGIGLGIKELIERYVYWELKFKKADFIKSESIDGKNYSFYQCWLRVTRPKSIDLAIEGLCPSFTCKDGSVGFLDELVIGDSEIQYKLTKYIHDTDEYISDGWRTLREGLNIMDAALLFEYIEDLIEENQLDVVLEK